MKPSYTYSEQINRINNAIKWGNYQLLITILIFGMMMINVCTLLIIPIMQIEPSFSYNGQYITNALEFCNNTYSNMSVDDYDSIQIDPSSIFNWAYIFKLVCNADDALSMIGISYFTGSIISNLILSPLADIFGRRKVILWSSFTMLLSVLQLLYLRSIFQLLIFCSITGLSTVILPTSLVMMSESINEKDSGLAISIGYISYPLCGLINAVLMYYMRDWRYFLSLLVFISFSTTFIAFIYLKESPKWLLANNFDDELNNNLKFIAKMNCLTENDLNYKCIGSNESGSNDITNANPNNSLDNPLKDPRMKKQEYPYTILDLFTNKSVRGLTFKVIMIFISTSYAFYGLFLNLGGLSNDIYINAAVTFSGEIVADIICGSVLYLIGRKSLLLFSCLFSASCLILYYLAGLFSDVFQVVVLFLSAFGVASSYTAICVYSPELFPTNVRSLSMNFFTAISRIAGSLVFVSLRMTKEINAISIGLLIISTIITFTMPESKDFNPGDEIEEMRDKISSFKNNCIDNEVMEDILVKC